MQGQKLDKIPERSFKKSTTRKAPAGTPDALEEKSIGGKTKKLTSEELAFLKQFRHLEELEREKGIKFFECIGDPPATDDFVENVQVLRNNFIENKKDRMREEDCNRFSTVINSDKVVVPTNIDITKKPKWDVYQNNHFSMRKRLVEIFLKVVNK